MAIIGVVVIPERGKRRDTWMGSSEVCLPVPEEVVGDAWSDDASGGVVNSGSVDKIHMRDFNPRVSWEWVLRRSQVTKNL